MDGKIASGLIGIRLGVWFEQAACGFVCKEMLSSRNGTLNQQKKNRYAVLLKMVGMTRFERATPSSQGIF